MNKTQSALSDAILGETKLASTAGLLHPDQSILSQIRPELVTRSYYLYGNATASATAGSLPILITDPSARHRWWPEDRMFFSVIADMLGSAIRSVASLTRRLPNRRRSRTRSGAGPFAFRVATPVPAPPLVLDIDADETM